MPTPPRLISDRNWAKLLNSYFAGMNW
jgi:hypothetical protein